MDGGGPVRLDLRRHVKERSHLSIHPRGRPPPRERCTLSCQRLEAGSFTCPPEEDWVRGSGPPAEASGEDAVEIGMPAERVGSYSHLIGQQQLGEYKGARETKGG